MASSSHHHPSVAVEADDSQYTYTTTTPQTAQPFGVYTRYGSYASYTLANYNAQRSAAFFGTVPRYAVDLSAACVDETQYQHPDALSSGLVVPADEFVSHEQPDQTWLGHTAETTGPYGPVPLTPAAMLFAAAQRSALHGSYAHGHLDVSDTSSSAGASGLHINTDVPYVQSYASSTSQLSAITPPQTLSPVSAYDTGFYSPFVSPSSSQQYQTYGHSSTSSIASPLNPGDEPFIFHQPQHHFASADVVSISCTEQASYAATNDSSELAHWSSYYTSAYDAHSSQAQSPAEQPVSTPLAVPTPRAPATDDVRQRLERYVSDSPDRPLSPSADAHDHAHPAAQKQPSPAVKTEWPARVTACWDAQPHAHRAFAEHLHRGPAPPPTDLPTTSAHASSFPREKAPRSSSPGPAGGAERKRRRKRTPEPRKPLVMACLFCRGRKIACGPPPPGSADKSCDQCRRRGQHCEYPTECRRGQRRPRPDPAEGADAAEGEDGSSRARGRTESHERPMPQGLVSKLAPSLSMPSLASSYRSSLAIKLEGGHGTPRML